MKGGLSKIGGKKSEKKTHENQNVLENLFSFAQLGLETKAGSSRPWTHHATPPPPMGGKGGIVGPRVPTGPRKASASSLRNARRSRRVRRPRAPSAGEDEEGEGSADGGGQSGNLEIGTIRNTGVFYLCSGRNKIIHSHDRSCPGPSRWGGGPGAGGSGTRRGGRGGGPPRPQ